MTRLTTSRLWPAHPVAALWLALASAGLAAQSDPHAGHHMPSPPPPTATDDHASHAAVSSAEPTQEMGHDDTGTSHADMQMDGSDAPKDARDPHAYSGGLALQDGPYALPGPRQLHMADEHYFGSVLADRLERVGADEDFTAYDLQAWYGKTYRKAVIKAEGDIARGKLEESSTQLLYSHATARYWDVQTGLRHDSSSEADRSWFALGIQGLAPYWFEIDATLFIGEQGRSAFSIEAEYELLFTQRLVLQPRIEINVYGSNDSETGTGSGLADSAAGLRLRYEFSRQFAPYIGVEWTNQYGHTADFSTAKGNATRDTQYVAGVRFWY